MNPHYQAPNKKKDDNRRASAPGTQRRLIGSQRTQRNSRIPSNSDMMFSADAAKTLINESKKQALASKEDTNEDKN